jgi:hypothetical protein
MRAECEGRATPRSLLGDNERQRIGAGVSLLDLNLIPHAGGVDLPVY